MQTYWYLYGGAIGETVFAAHLAQSLAANQQDAQLVCVSTRRSAMAAEFVKPLPHAWYIERPKGSPASWLWLLQQMWKPHRIVVHQPLSGHMPLWWKLLLRALTWRKGSVEVRCTPSTSASHVPARARSVIYNPAHDQIFDTVPKLVEALGVFVSKKPAVHIGAELFAPGLIPKSKTIIFHFFAPSVKRSLPVTKARELLSAVHAAFPERELVVTADEAHHQQAVRMAEDLPVRVLVGASVGELTKLIASSSAYVGVDTGITHIAASLGASVVMLGNWSNPCWLPTYAPRTQILVNREHCLCNGDKTGDCFYSLEGGNRYRCMIDIPTEAVVDALKKALPAHE